MSRFDLNAAWWDERVQELENEFESFNPFDEPLLSFRMQGTYILRLLPPLDPREHFRTVGEHWNVFLGDNMPMSVGCPRVNFGQTCVLCDAADSLIATKRMNRQDLFGMGKWGVKRKQLVRALLVKFTPMDKAKTVTLPDLPVMRVVSLPIGVGKKLVELEKGGVDLDVTGPNSGRAAMYDEEQGSPVRIVKSEKLDGWYSVDLLRNAYRIDESFLDTESWPLISDFVPQTKNDEILALMMRNKRDLPVELLDYFDNADAIDIPPSKPALPPPGVKRLPPSNGTALPQRAKPTPVKARRLEPEPPPPDDDDAPWDDDEELEKKLRDI